MIILSLICTFLLICILIVLIVSFFENRSISISNYIVKSNKIKKDIKIVMIADFHNAIFKDNNKYLIEKIRNCKPEAIFIAGDILVCNKHEKHPRKSTLDFLDSISFIAPVYYSMGNHEYGSKYNLKQTDDLWSEYTKFIDSKSDKIKLLDNSSLNIEISGNKIDIYGLTLDKSFFKRFHMQEIDTNVIKQYIYINNDNNFHILMAHNPDYFDCYSRLNVDLVLSGHNHGGLIRLPFLGGVASPRGYIFPKYDSGLFDKNNKIMIATRGLGSHSLRVRFNNKPEICLVTLKKE